MRVRAVSVVSCVLCGYVVVPERERVRLRVGAAVAGPGAWLSVATRMTSSLFSDGPPLTPPSSSPLCGHPNDTTLALSSLSYVIHQLSTLLLYTAPSPTHSTLSPSPRPALLTHSFLVAALSNVLHTSLQLVSPSFPPSPLPTLSSPPTPSLSTSTPTLPTHVTSPHSSPSPAHDAAPLSPPTSLPSPLSASILPSSSSPIVAAADSRHTIRVLTAIQTLPVQPSSAPITKLKHCSPAAARGHPSSVSPLRHASSSAIPPHTANPFAVLSHHHAPTRSSTRRPRRHSLPSSCPPHPTASPTYEHCLQATSPLSKASAQLAHQSHGGVPGGSGYGEGDASTPPATTATLTAATISTRSTATTIDPHPLPSTAQPTPPTDSFDSSAAPPATTAPSSPPLPLLPTHPTHTTHNPTTGSSPSLPLTGTGDGRDADVLQATQPLPISASTSSSHTVQPVAAVTCQATETAARTPTAIHDTTASPAAPTPTPTPSTSPPTLLLTPADAAAARSEDAVQATQPLLFEASASPHLANTPAAATIGHQTERPAIPAASFRTARSISTPIPLDFHARLGTRRPSHARHFDSRFSPSGPLCQCKRFPVYSSGSIDQPEPFPLSVLNDLCLDCIASVLDTRYGTEPEIGDVFFTERLRYRWRRFYSTFYTSQERDEMASWQTAEQHSRRQHHDMQRIVPWLSKRGVRRTCPHVAGTCHDVLCCRGTAIVQAVEEQASPADQRKRAQKNKKAERRCDVGGGSTS